MVLTTVVLKSHSCHFTLQFKLPVAYFSTALRGCLAISEWLSVEQSSVVFVLCRVQGLLQFRLGKKSRDLKAGRLRG
uniref:Uncharacterized protein n=1 Tax=Helianthus annuus TaxID=4232 RepID=A0A251T1G7_HELAN